MIQVPNPMPPHRRPLGRWLLGMIFIIASLAAAAMLVLQHLGSIELPGCGPQSGCELLAASRWGNVLGWPVSFLGTAWFAALLAAWMWTGPAEAISRWWKWGVRASMAGSVFFLTIMLLERHLCPYCLIVHSGNLAFGGVVALYPGLPKAPIGLPLAIGAIVFASITAALSVVQQRVQDEARTHAEEQFQAALRRILENAKVQARLPDSDAGEPGFTGR